MRLIDGNLKNVAWLAIPLAIGLIHCSGSPSGAASSAESGDDSSSTTSAKKKDAGKSSSSSGSSGSSDDTAGDDDGSGDDDGGSGDDDSGTGSAGTKGKDGGTATGTGSDSGTSTGTPGGGVLAPPPAGQGIQITSGALNVPAGQEVFYCQLIQMPTSAGKIEVGNFVSHMSTGSHHMILNIASDSEKSSLPKDGTPQSCLASTGQWIYASSSEDNRLDMPPDVGLPFDAGEYLTLNTHDVNPSTKSIQVQVFINIGYVQNVKYEAGAMVSFNGNIFIAPNSKATFGSQCKIAAGSKMFAISTHTHKNATSTTIDYVTGGQHTQLVNTTDWEHPDSKVWTAPNFLVTKDGDYFEEKCHYTNATGGPIIVGETAATNEMCMQIGYYYPAPAGQKTGLGASGCTYPNFTN